jgi:hypothetical protein
MAINTGMVDIKNVLLEKRKIFQSAATECIDSYFQKTSVVREPWTLCERLEGSFDHIASIGCSNNSFQAIMTANINSDSLSAFVGAASSEEEVPDILGEFCNTYCGLLMDKKEVKESFGILLQALPLYSAHLSFFPKTTGIHGKVHIGSSWIYMGYAVRGNPGVLL